MLCIIGNSPSSGSTLLADLLDSTDVSACGNELSLFSNRRVYDFHKFKANIHVSSSTSCVGRIRNTVNFHRLYGYGLNEGEFKELITSSDDLPEFANKFVFNFLAVRGKDPDGVVFEKTPDNIGCISEFTDTFKSAYFIFIVRNPVYVYPSVLKRKLPPYVAGATWLTDAAKYMNVKQRENVLLVRYEDLVARPYRSVQEIMRRVLGVELEEGAIEQAYKNNHYRKIRSKKRLPWTITKTGEVGNANTKAIDQDTLKAIGLLMNAKVSAGYARKFDLAEISFTDALKEFGYYDDVLRALKDLGPAERPPTRTVKDTLFLGLKWAADVCHLDASFSDLKSYLNPIGPLNQAHGS